MPWATSPPGPPSSTSIGPDGQARRTTPTTSVLCPWTRPHLGASTAPAPTLQDHRPGRRFRASKELGARQQHCRPNFARARLAAAWDGVRHRRGPTAARGWDGVSENPRGQGRAPRSAAATTRLCRAGREGETSGGRRRPLRSGRGTYASNRAGRRLARDRHLYRRIRVEPEAIVARRREFTAQVAHDDLARKMEARLASSAGRCREREVDWRARPARHRPGRQRRGRGAEAGSGQPT